jgi:hypothetical protein
MNTFINKFFSIANNISQEKGPLTLLALFELEEHEGQWDVVVSARNLPEDDMDTLRFVINQMNAVLNKQEILQISSVVILDVEQMFVKEIEEFLDKHNNPQEFFSSEINGIQIKQAFIIVSPIKESSKILVDASTFNDLMRQANQVNQLKPVM